VLAVILEKKKEMKKTFKVLGIIVLVFVIIGGIIAYNISKKMEKVKLAEDNSKFIIENLDKEIVYKEFPDKNFPNQTQLRQILGGIKQNCDWGSRKGKFIDFCTMKNIGGTNQIAYIYEYYLKCDSLRFILIYDIDKDKPELSKFNIEPIEVENKMIIFPEKQLKNQR